MHTLKEVGTSGPSKDNLHTTIDENTGKKGSSPTILRLGLLAHDLSLCIVNKHY
jgi:hypothetical protein